MKTIRGEREKKVKGRDMEKSSKNTAKTYGQYGMLMKIESMNIVTFCFCVRRELFSTIP